MKKKVRNVVLTLLVLASAILVFGLVSQTAWNVNFGDVDCTQTPDVTLSCSVNDAATYGLEGENFTFTIGDPWQPSEYGLVSAVLARDIPAAQSFYSSHSLCPNWVSTSSNGESHCSTAGEGCGYMTSDSGANIDQYKRVFGDAIGYRPASTSGSKRACGATYIIYYSQVVSQHLTNELLIINGHYGRRAVVGPSFTTYGFCNLASKDCTVYNVPSLSGYDGVSIDNWTIYPSMFNATDTQICNLANKGLQSCDGNYYVTCSNYNVVKQRVAGKCGYVGSTSGTIGSSTTTSPTTTTTTTPSNTTSSSTSSASNSASNTGGSSLSTVTPISDASTQESGVDYTTVLFVVAAVLIIITVVLFIRRKR